jgi:hypothetical protein
MIWRRKRRGLQSDQTRGIIMTKTVCAMPLAILMATAAAVPAVASPTFYTDEAAFHAASAALTIESFESPVDETLNSSMFADILAVSSGYLFRDTQHPTDGAQALLVNTSSLSFSRYHMPYKFTSFAIDAVKWVTQEGSIRFDTDNGSHLFDFDGSYFDADGHYRDPKLLFFFGVVDPDGFSEVTLTPTVIGDVAGYDRLQSSTLPPPTGVVPEPAAWLSMIVGLALVGMGQRRRSRAFAA